MKSSREIFTENLNRIMFRQNVTQAELANAVGVSQGAVYFWTSGKKYPRADKIEQIADALGVRFSDLVTDHTTDAEGEDDDLWEIRERLRRDPQMRMLFSAASKVTPEHLRAVVAMVKALEPEEFPDDAPQEFPDDDADT